MSSSRPLVVKIGGSTFGEHDSTLDDIAHRFAAGNALVVVHGGGRVASEWASRLAVPSSFVRGLRVTSPEMLEVVVATLAGLVNKQLVASLVARGAPAVGVSGIDAGLIRAHVADPALGLVGDVDRVEIGLIWTLLSGGFLPVVATAALGEGGTILNINGDTAAALLAAALRARGLVLLSDVPGVLDSSGRTLPRLSASQARALIASGVASGGMVPKLEFALRALEAVDWVAIVDGRQPGALLAALDGNPAGTILSGDER